MQCTVLVDVYTHTHTHTHTGSEALFSNNLCNKFTLKVECSNKESIIYTVVYRATSYDDKFYYERILLSLVVQTCTVFMESSRFCMHT